MIQSYSEQVLVRYWFSSSLKMWPKLLVFLWDPFFNERRTSLFYWFSLLFSGLLLLLSVVLSDCDTLLPILLWVDIVIFNFIIFIYLNVNQAVQICAWSLRCGCSTGLSSRDDLFSVWTISNQPNRIRILHLDGNHRKVQSCFLDHLPT